MVGPSGNLRKEFTLKKDGVLDLMANNTLHNLLKEILPQTASIKA